MSLISKSLISKTNGNLGQRKLPGGMHYAWVIVGILAVVQMIDSSIGMAAGIMVDPLSDPDGDFGWSVGAIGAAIAVYFVVGAVFAPITGWLGDRYGARRMMLVSAILFFGGMFFLGAIGQVWHFILAFGIILALTSSITYVALMAAVSPWFRRRLGLGTGVLWAAGGVGTALLPPLVGYLLVNVGWQATFWGIGAAGGGIVLLLTFFFRTRPADLSIKPYGASDNDPPEVVTDAATEKLRARVFNKHMRRTKAFWNLPTIHALGCAGHGIVLIYAIPIAVDRGVGLVEAGLMITIISLVSIISRLVTPVLCESYGPKQVMFLCLMAQGLTALMLFWAQDLWMFYLFAAVFGLGFGGEWTGYMVINRQYFGYGPMGSCYGWQMSGALLGHALTAGLAGLAIYVTGSFIPVIILSIAFSVGGALLILTLESTSRVLIPDWEESLPPEARSAVIIAASEAD